MSETHRASLEADRSPDTSIPDSRRQFCDFGPQCRSGIFCHDAQQERLARETEETLTRSGRFSDSIATEITEATEFYAAEVYHRDYYLKNPLRYKFYRYQCGREKRLRQLWGGTN